MKNKSLLRRGPFEVPLQSHTSAPLEKNLHLQKTEFLRSKVLSKKHSQTMAKIQGYQVSTDKKKGFDKTLTHFAEQYSSMKGDERASKEEKRSFKNSMNRVLAAEMIKYRLHSAGETMRSKKTAKPA